MAHTPVPMLDAKCFETMREPRRELASVVGLDHFKYEGRFFLRCTHELRARLGADLRHHFCIRPAGEEVDECIYIQNASVRKTEVHGISLQQGSRMKSDWSWCRIMRALPGTPLAEQAE